MNHQRLMLEAILLPAKIKNRLVNGLFLAFRKVQVDGALIINGRIIVKGSGRIIIGKDVVINSSLFENPAGLATCTILHCYPGANMKIGEGTGISNSLICAMNSVDIGKRVTLGGGVQIHDTDYHSIDPLLRQRKPDINIRTAPVIIGDDVFIGACAIVLKGSQIGDRSVIGAGSVIAGHIPADEIWAGNPARFVKKLEPSKISV